MGKKKREEEVPVSRKERGMKKTTPSHLLTPFEEMEQMFGRLLPQGWARPFDLEHPFWRDMPSPFAGRLAPRVDIIERDKEIIVRAQLPGVEKKDIDLSINDNSLTIKGRTSHEEKEEKGDYYRRECSSGSFTRTFMLPHGVDGSKAKATFKNGVLELTIPKSEAPAGRKIEIE